MSKPHKLAVARIEAGFTSQRVFATACDLSTCQVANYERGYTKRPRLSTLITMAKVLGISAHDVNKFFKK